MRIFLLIVGLLVALMGTAWALQGAHVLPASFMADPIWIAIGGAVALLGIFMMWKARGTKPVSGPAPPA